MANTHYHLLDAYEEEIGVFASKRAVDQARFDLEEDGTEDFSFPLSVRECRRNGCSPQENTGEQ